MTFLNSSKKEKESKNKLREYGPYLLWMNDHFFSYLPDKQQLNERTSVLDISI